MVNISTKARTAPDRKVRFAVKGSQQTSMSAKGAPRVVPLPNAAVGTLRFGSFQVLPYQRLLLDRDAPVQLGSRAFDVLIALLEQPGQLVSKEELIARVWPDTTVDEGNLRAHVANLRKALHGQDDGSKIICTIPGRGYRFIAPVTHSRADSASLEIADAALAQTDLPTSHPQLFGRDEFVRTLVAQLSDYRLITIVGPGGVGKTRVAIAVGQALAGSYSHGVCFADLTSLSEHGRVPDLLANALGIGRRHETSTLDLISYLKDKQMLIVIDNCEHVADATAHLVENILGRTSGIDILATAREPLRNSGERLYRLPPLGCPPPSEVSASEILTYPAVQLFVDRISMCNGAPELNDNNALAIAEICRKLDGIPLALELAASRVEVFGLNGIVSQVDQPLKLLSCGRRTANQRHQTLSGMLDWSSRLLGESERAVLLLLAKLTGEFSLSDACTAAGSVGIGDANIEDNIASLVSKSLIAADASKGVARYRLLNTTRAYVLGKFAASNETDTARRRDPGLIL
jgi:predicted ATPase/DNA-binding winged helix-turn-helix (wHTH) protein